MTRHRIGLVGCGRWGVHVLRDLLALGCEVTVVARSTQTRSAAEAAGASASCATIEELPRVGGIVISTPTTTHAEVAAEALGHGVPVFVEKPLTNDVAAARALLATAPDRLFVMHKWRYHPGVERMAEIARGDELGRPVALHTKRVGWGNPHSDVDGVWMLAPHDLSIGLEVLGAIPEPMAARVERVGDLVTGMTALLGDDPAMSIEVSIAHPVRSRQVRLVCSDGVALLADPYSDHLLITRGELQGTITRDEKQCPISTELPLLRELRAFLDHLDGGPPPRSNGPDALADVEAIAALCALGGARAR